MRSKSLLGSTLALAGVVVMWSCGGGGSTLAGGGTTSTLMAPTSPGASLKPKDEDPAPMPDPVPDPNVDPAPGPGADPVPDPNALTINIVGSFGSAAFVPNPIQAAVGNMIVWKNNDRTLHHIVLDDGSEVGDVPPDASSAPMPLRSAAVTYYCTIHPTMVGIIGDASALPPPPSVPAPPPDDYYGGYSVHPRRAR